MLEDEIGFGVESSPWIPRARMTESIKNHERSVKHAKKTFHASLKNPLRNEIRSWLEAKEWHEA